MSEYDYTTIVASESVQVALQDLVTQEEKIVNINVAVYTADDPRDWYYIWDKGLERNGKHYPYCVLIITEEKTWYDPTARPWHTHKEEARKRMEMLLDSLRKGNLLSYVFCGLNVETRFVLKAGEISLKTVFVE